MTTPVKLSRAASRIIRKEKLVCVGYGGHPSLFNRCTPCYAVFSDGTQFTKEDFLCGYLDNVLYFLTPEQLKLFPHLTPKPELISLFEEKKKAAPKDITLDAKSIGQIWKLKDRDLTYVAMIVSIGGVLHGVDAERGNWLLRGNEAGAVLFKEYSPVKLADSPEGYFKNKLASST